MNTPIRYIAMEHKRDLPEKIRKTIGRPTIIISGFRIPVKVRDNDSAIPFWIYSGKFVLNGLAKIIA